MVPGSKGSINFVEHFSNFNVPSWIVRSVQNLLPQIEDFNPPYTHTHMHTHPYTHAHTHKVTVPALPGEPSDFSALRPLDDLAQQIFAAGTRVIYTFTFAPNDIYLYHEAIRYVQLCDIYISMGKSFNVIMCRTTLKQSLFGFENVSRAGIRIWYLRMHCSCYEVIASYTHTHTCICMYV